MPIIHNVKYRPDCNGIEEIWGWAKKLYRPLVLYHKAMNLDWDQIEVVTKIMEQVPQETASKYVQRGFTALRNAEPIGLEDDSILKERGFNSFYLSQDEEDDEMNEDDTGEDQEN